MWHDYEPEDEQLKEWHQINFKYIWQCPNCEFHYESEPFVNEALLCPTCGIKTEKAGESYDA